MAVLVTFTAGLVWWVVAAAFGIKAFDAFLLTVAMTITAAAVVMLRPFVNQLLGKETAAADERGAAL